MNNTTRVSMMLESMPANYLIEASRLYALNFDDMSETSFYKTLERLCKRGELNRLTRGVYYRAKASRFGIVPISDSDIASYYTDNLSGVVIGYRLYNQKGLTTQIGKRTEVLSNRLTGQQKTLDNVVVRKIPIELNPERVAVIEAFEILQNYSGIQDLNIGAFRSYMNDFRKVYSNSDAEYVIENMKYKKSTIAFLEALLNHMQVENTLGKYLSSLSVYTYPSMEEIYETA